MHRTTVLAALLLVAATATWSLAGEPTPDADTLFLANFGSLAAADHARGSASMTNHAATLAPGRWGQGLRVGPGQHLAIPSAGNLDPKQGTILFWFKPNWSTTGGQGSHALLSWGWDDGKGGYGVLSDGWWEPAGAGRTYFVFENQLYAHCNCPISYTKGKWMHVGLTWEFGKRLAIALFLDGRQIAATTGKAYTAIPKLNTPLCVGSDRGSSLRRGRSADGVFDGLTVLGRALSKEEVRAAFRRQEPNWRQVEAARDAWLTDVIKQPYRPTRDAQGRVLESRALLDEWSRWASREGAEQVLDRMVRAGFNVYIPCVWHGRGARWPSKLTPMESAVQRIVQQQGGAFDPLEHLIRLCHAKGIEVHPWFCVCYGDPKWEPLRPFIDEGTPKGACEAHNPQFRKFIVDLMMEVVRRYDVDGVNLDYIRTKGLSKSKIATESFRKRHGMDLLEAAKQREPNGWPNAKVVQWQNDAIADIVRTVSQRARQAKPGILISIDGHPRLPTDAPGTQGRDGFWWAQEGWIDVIYSMDYGWNLSWQKADAVRAALDRPEAFVAIAGNYDRLPSGKVVSRDAPRVADLIAFGQRKSRGNGVALYWYGSLDDAQIEALRRGPFKEPAVPHWVRARRAD